ncbi:3-dehydroquinate synthase [Alkaliphilus pronyensis]|uniref:3-dehydroquinate synthase n=1 Tax=Alkaliphilus pronyensis TaxID=1482732 RepID=A0A6I0F6X1_9FIRM|nr:3-dehydroquinate synthase [Alkaliphilus pronyensis]KAB3529232.1 3-dehydroquinate synthase [Alkaliphilus pronyensis]
MERLYIDLGEASYFINIKGGLLKNLTDYINGADQYIIITDTNVDNIYSYEIAEALKDNLYHKYIIPSGEASKNYNEAMKILSFMIEKNSTRKTTIIALGGGVVGDIAGFCASIFMRGVGFIQVPTTLLAQVDSSVGGKTAVNLPMGKNLIGTFYQPSTVIIDTELLRSLSRKEIISGIGEIVKYGVVYDYSFLKFIKENLSQIIALEPLTITYVIKKCCQIKAEVVSRDERELRFRKILNYGHTIGHAIEAITDYKKYTHGEAVLCGMYLEAMLSMELELLDKCYYQEILNIIQDSYGEVKLSDISREKLIEALAKDKKNVGGKISFILPTTYAKVTEVLLSKKEVEGLLLQILGRSIK